ncbi:MAG: hypothetical protein HY721_22270 [Planctomycetes bacterium]|nr:hypothetical protein [Planctomycetota bacterium]
MRPHLARRTSFTPSVLALVASWAPALEAQSTSFRRGDANLDGRITLADAGYLLNALFFRGPRPACDDAADFDDDGALAAKDLDFLMDWLFPLAPGVPDPPPPFGAAGKDSTADPIGCLDGTVKPPAPPDPGLKVALEVPAAVERGQKGVEVFVEATLDGPI